MSYWTGDEWRWGLCSKGRTSISVIERTLEDEEEARKRKGQRVPFGFAREVPRIEHEPLLWEGDGA